MQVADSATVLGDFAGRVMVHFGDTTRLTQQGNRWLQNAAGADGRHADFPVAFTFGLRPLQQYLTPFSRGRLQVLPAIWDTRPVAQGGQRWFHLYPADSVPPGDELHWTGRAQNWNYMCAECHVTGYRKGYVAATDSFATRWSELGVGCEGCHGPGSAHAEDAKRVQDGGRWRDTLTYGLAVSFHERRGAAFRWDSAAHRPVRSVPPEMSRPELDACARCHSRRAQVWGDVRAGRPLMDSHQPELLTQPLYYADGQIREEVYEYGSFLQSRMYQRGVTCSDCHDPHSQRLRAPGNAVCSQCHSPLRYDTPGHTFHRAGTAGAACVDCHMAPRTYMVVDVRRDHSLRIPRPDLSQRIGSPNACNQCHTDRDARWAAEQVARWYGPGRMQGPHYGDVFAKAEAGDRESAAPLVAVAGNADLPAIVRATALHELARYPSPEALRVIAGGLASSDPLLRLGALDALEGFEPIARLSFAEPLLGDPVRVVRMAAAMVLAAVPADRLAGPTRKALERGLAEYRASQDYNADQPWSWLSLGYLALQQGHQAQAESGYRAAMRLDSSFVPAYVNLADLYRGTPREAEGELLLRRAITVAPGNADAHYALALSMVRRHDYPGAQRELARAAQLAPEGRRITEALAAMRNRPGGGP